MQLVYNRFHVESPTELVAWKNQLHALLLINCSGSWEAACSNPTRPAATAGLWDPYRNQEVALGWMFLTMSDACRQRYQRHNDAFELMKELFNRFDDKREFATLRDFLGLGGVRNRSAV